MKSFADSPLLSFLVVFLGLGNHFSLLKLKDAVGWSTIPQHKLRGTAIRNALTDKFVTHNSPATAEIMTTSLHISGKGPCRVT